MEIQNKLEDLEDADDIALISSKFNDIQNKTTAVKEWAEKAGLKSTSQRQKTMRINTKLDRPIKIDGYQLEKVEEFTYLGWKEGGASEDIKQ